ncbi:muscular LMNA-interacting protein isoform X2 [Melanotaenia boesemani]|nr:muscular LMNA-interacting protein isoform X2 [Melanotaenia boesemani]
MSDGQIFKAKIVFIKDILEGHTAEPNLKSPHDHVSLSLTRASPSVNAWSKNTPSHLTKGTVPMETAVDKQRGISRQKSHDISRHAEVSLGCFADITSMSEDRTSPTLSADLFPTPASSRESILSEGSDKDRSWSAMPLSSVTSPASFSRTVSSCSSIRSGVFSPAVIQIKRHFLAPGSSLVHIPQTCFSSCDSLSSVCSEISPPRHRPPLTRLSLLTAILRKGRLPVLSPTPQRPYTPCWPVNPVTLSFCNACSAASSVASTPLHFSSQFSSSTSIDSQNHVHREPSRCITAPPTVESGVHKRTYPQTDVKKCSGQIGSRSELRREPIISPPPVKSNTLPQSPLPLYSNSKSVTQMNLDKAGSASTLHSSISKSSNTHMFMKGHTDGNFKKLISPSIKLVNESKTSAPQKLTLQPNSSLSKLHSLSQQLRSLPASPPHLQPSQSRITVSYPHTDAASPFPPSQNTSRVGGCTSERSCPVSRSVTPLQAFQKSHNLSPSRYTPIALSGWLSPTSTQTLTPSPAPTFRDFTPSPSLSLRSTPSPRPGSGISDCSDREGKKRKVRKIKSSYKSLAAIPTNTLLLEQQVIDEQVEKEQSPHDTLNRCVKDTHAEMCSPAQLRQQSEELYAVIDEILANSIPATSTSPITKTGFQQRNSSFPKSLGRETKYASLCSLHPSTGKEKKLMDPKKTKPGIIRPNTAIPSLTGKVEDKFNPNSFQQLLKQTLIEKKKRENTSLEEGQRDLYAGSSEKTLNEERMPERGSPFSVCELHIKEPGEDINHLSKEAPTSFSTTEKHMEAFETHI